MDFMGRIERVLNFIYELNINEKTEMVFRIFDALFYFSVLRIIILFPLFIILGVIIFKILFKDAKGILPEAFMFGYIIFLILLCIGVGIDIMILVIGISVTFYLISQFISNIINLYIEIKSKYLEKLDKIIDKLK